MVVASSLYQLTSLNLNNLNPSSSWFPPWIYYPSKYANISFTLELARRLEGSGVTANCLHPGLIDSGIWRNVPVPLNWPLKVIVKCFFKSPEQGKFSAFCFCLLSELLLASKKYLVLFEPDLTFNFIIRLSDIGFPSLFRRGQECDRKIFCGMSRAFS